MSKGELICPKTEEPCQFYGYCMVTKRRMSPEQEVVDDTTQDLIDELAKRVPAELLAADRSSFCSEQRIDAIIAAEGDLTEDFEHTTASEREQVENWALGLADTIAKNRLIFTHTAVTDENGYLINAQASPTEE